MRTSPFIALSAAVTLGAFCTWGEAQTERSPEYRVKTRYIARLAEYTTWPASALPAPQGKPIVMGVLGTVPFEPFVKELESAHRIHGRGIKLIALRHPHEARNCQIVFIAASESHHLGEILSLLRGHPVLTIGDTPGYAAKGVMINLIPTQNRLIFEINQSALKASSMVISSHVLKLAQLVE